MNFSDLKIGERLKSLEYVYLKIDDYRAVNVDSLVVVSIDPDCEVDKVPKWSDELTNIERGVLLELVYGVIDSMQTDGVDTIDNPNFVAYCNLYQKLGGTPPAPHSESGSSIEHSEPLEKSPGFIADTIVGLVCGEGEENE